MTKKDGMKHRHKWITIGSLHGVRVKNCLKCRLEAEEERGDTPIFDRGAIIIIFKSPPDGAFEEIDA